MLFIGTGHCGFRNPKDNDNIPTTQTTMSQTNTTTRRFARTMSEAFPRDMHHAYAIEQYRAPMYWAERVIGWAAIIGCVSLIVWAALQCI